MVLASALVAIHVAGVSHAAAQEQTQPASSSKPHDELGRVENELNQAKQNQRKLQTHLEDVRADRLRLQAALLQTAAKARDYEGQALDVEGRLAAAESSVTAIKKSLSARRLLIAKVLAVLQRMSRKPPPAVLVDPNDILSAIRTSMLLGSLLPEMRTEVESLAGDLADLMHAKQSVSREKQALSAAMAKLDAERSSLQAEIRARQDSQASIRKDLAADTAHAQDLARKAANLRDLIAKMDAASQQKVASLVPAGIAAPTPFRQRRGSLEIPVEGTLIKNYGDRDIFGAAESGEAFTTLPGAVVTSPVAGWVAYSGSYRSYGKLLILNAGDGYYVVMAGMERINVEVGQYVVAGEPIAQMGDGSIKTAAAIAIGVAKPVFYVEFRKNGATIDPGPWWAKSNGEKVRG